MVSRCRPPVQHRAAAVAFAFACLLSFPATAEPASKGAPGVISRYEPTVAEAAERFAIPRIWIDAVIDIESHGDPRAVSPKGAIGLMQLKPKTYAALRLRYALGADAFDPHDNIMAGAAYLREMYDRFGASGFLAAYNAGPKRFHDHLATGRPLPLATSAYVAQLALRLGASLPDGASIDAGGTGQWQTSSLFAAHAKPNSDEGAGLFVSASPSRTNDSPHAGSSALSPHQDSLFIALTDKKATP